MHIKLAHYSEPYNGAPADILAILTDDLKDDEYIRVRNLGSDKTSWNTPEQKREPIPVEPDVEMDGTAQTFNKSYRMIFLPEPDGQRRILVLGQSGVREYPD